MNLLPSYRISSLNVQSLTPAAARLYRVPNLNSNYLSPRDTITRELCSEYLFLSYSSAKSRFRQLPTDQPSPFCKQVMVIYPRGRSWTPPPICSKRHSSQCKFWNSKSTFSKQIILHIHFFCVLNLNTKLKAFAFLSVYAMRKVENILRNCVLN